MCYSSWRLVTLSEAVTRAASPRERRKVGIVTEKSVSALGLGWGRALRDVHEKQCGELHALSRLGWAGLGWAWGGDCRK